MSGQSSNTCFAIDLDAGRVLVPANEIAGIPAIDAPEDDGGEYLITPRVVRQIGFGRNPFRTYPTVEDPRVIGVAEYLPPGTPRSDGELSRHWAAVLMRADGVSQYLTITCLRDATDPLFEHMNAADKAVLAAPFVGEAA